MVTYLRKSLNKIIHNNKNYTLTYFNEKGEERKLKKEKELYELCLCNMNEQEMIEKGIISQYSIDIDNACKYVWDFNIKKALLEIINERKKLGITIIQATYNKEQFYSINNENIKRQELENIKKQRDVYKQQVDVQKEIIRIMNEENSENEDMEI